MAESRRARDPFAHIRQRLPKDPAERTQVRQAWLEQARAGSYEAYGELVVSFQPMMWSFVCGELSPELLRKVGGEDLVQSAAFLALRAFDKFHGCQVPQFRDLIMTICRHLLITSVQRYAPGTSQDISREQPLDDDAAQHAYGRQPMADEVLASLEERDGLLAALAKLPADQRQVVTWRHVDGLSFVAIADLLGWTRNAVERSFKQALTTLRGCLGQKRAGL